MDSGKIFEKLLHLGGFQGAYCPLLSLPGIRGEAERKPPGNCPGFNDG